MTEKKCAACGKVFQPKGRERYCEGPHYKPCPVCGVDVVATYWSDPPKRCEKCRAANAKPQKQITAFQHMMVGTLNKVVEPIPAPKEIDNPTITVELADGDDVRVYIGPEGRGIPFKVNHTYILKLEKEEKYGCYAVSSSYDITAEADINAYIRYSSMNSIDRYFKKSEATNDN